MVLWLQGLISVTEKANYQGTRRLPICFFFPTWLLLGEKASKQATRVVWKRENFHLLSHFKLPFFALSLSTLCGMQWYLWPISETKPLSIPITWLPFASTLPVHNGMLHIDGVSDFLQGVSRERSLPHELGPYGSN